MLFLDIINNGADGPDNITVALGVLTIIISAAAYYNSRKAYKRDNSLNTENHLFEKKLETYNFILGELDSLLDFCNDLYLDLKHKVIETGDQLESRVDEVDERIYKFDNHVIARSLHLSDSVEDKMIDLTKELISGDPSKVDSWEELYNKLLNRANELSIDMREELQLEKLNSKLFRRLE